MNLYQYIRPLSNRPPGMIKGIIYSLLNTCKKQNTYLENHLDVVVKLFGRHAAWGWDKSVRKRMILEASSKLEQKSLLPNYSADLPANSTTENFLNSPNRLFICMEYSKNDMPKEAVRSIVDATFTETLDELNIIQTTVACFRPKKWKTSSQKPNCIKQKAMKLVNIILGTD